MTDVTTLTSNENFLAMVRVYLFFLPDVFFNEKREFFIYGLERANASDVVRCGGISIAVASWVTTDNARGAVGVGDCDVTENYLLLWACSEVHYLRIIA